MHVWGVISHGTTSPAVARIVRASQSVFPSMSDGLSLAFVCSVTSNACLNASLGETHPIDRSCGFRLRLCKTYRSILSLPWTLHITTLRSTVARSARQKPDTLDLFPISVREPKIEGLDLYTYAYICISVTSSS